jgi:hypothetical protein
MVNITQNQSTILITQQRVRIKEMARLKTILPIEDYPVVE